MSAERLGWHKDRPGSWYAPTRTGCYRAAKLGLIWDLTFELVDDKNLRPTTVNVNLASTLAEAKKMAGRDHQKRSVST